MAGYQELACATQPHAMEDNFVDVSENFNEQEENVTKAQADVNGQENIETFLREISSLKAENKSLKQKLKDYNERLKQILEDAQTTNTNTVEDLGNKLSVCKEEIKELTTENGKLKAQKDEDRETIEGLQNELKERESWQRLYTELSDDIQAKRSGKFISIEEHEKKRGEDKVRIEEYSKREKAERSQREHAESLRQKEKDEMKSLRKRCEELQTTVKREQEAAEFYKGECRNRQDKIESLKGEIEKLKKKKGWFSSSSGNDRASPKEKEYEKQLDSLKAERSELWTTIHEFYTKLDQVAEILPPTSLDQIHPNQRGAQHENDRGGESGLKDLRDTLRKMERDLEYYLNMLLSTVDENKRLNWELRKSRTPGAAEASTDPLAVENQELRERNQVLTHQVEQYKEDYNDLQSKCDKLQNDYDDLQRLTQSDASINHEKGARNRKPSKSASQRSTYVNMSCYPGRNGRRESEDCSQR